MQTVTVNDVAIPAAAVAREAQNHAAPTPEAAWEQANRALEALLQDVRAGTRRFLPYEHLKLYAPGPKTRLQARPGSTRSGGAGSPPD